MKLTITEIKDLVQATFGLEVTLRTRKKEYVYARVLFAEECRKSEVTLVRIGKELGVTHCEAWHYLNAYKPYAYLVSEYRPKFDKLKKEYEKSRI